MSFIYNLLYPENPVSKGLIEIVSVYDNNYHSIYLDGQEIQYLYKEDYENTIITRSFIKKCVKKSKTTEDKLSFVHYDLYAFGDKLLADYDANDYINNYEGVKALVIQDLQNFKDSYTHELGIGIENLEKNLGY